MLDVQQDDDLVTVTLAHGKVNALDLELVTAISAQFRGLAGDPRPVVLTGRGRSFCAGVDLHRIVAGGPAHVEQFLAALSEAFLAVFEHPAPVVAAVNGHALAGGCILAAACDLRVGTAGGGTIGVTELLVGVPFPTSAIEILRHAVGDARAAELVYQGRRVPVDEARDLGLLADLVDDADQLLPAAAGLARDLGARQRPAYTLAKHQLRRDAHDRIARHRSADEAAVTAIWASPETTAAIERFLSGLAQPRPAG